MVMRNNWINVRPGQRAFNVLTNMCDYFQIGRPDDDDVWLEGQIVEGEFLFNGRLYLHNGQVGTVIDSFPKGRRLTAGRSDQRLTPTDMSWWMIAAS